MRKVILDTNVIVSALISNSYPTKILHEIVFERKVETCISTEILEEYIHVLNRPKFERFPNFKNNAEVVINKFIEISTTFKPTEKLFIISDLSDNLFLELAKISEADFLITGNSTDFTFDKFENTQIVKPQVFYEQFV
ncbi:MAG: putative toxin-antitoxin system toxin component, PIN family [Chitinophagaceae bacterium]|nr:putative toxin-antitoxin system toxin component, PIN family [Chitinophagaceae bacterium]